MARRARHSGAMHVVTNRVRRGDREYTSHLLRRSYREGGKVRKETLANLSHLPEQVIELIRGGLRGERFLAAGEAFEIERSLPAGHVRAGLAMARRLEFARLLERAPSRERSLALALIVARVLEPASKLATARALGQSTLGSELGVGDACEDELYEAMDWLLARQERIEARLARRHLGAGTLVLYDVSSSYFEGRTCPLAQLGYSRDGRRGTAQIVYGLMCAPDGCPVAVEVFEGALHARAGDRRLRPRHGHQGQPRPLARASRRRLGDGPSRTAGQEARQGRRAAAVAVRPAQPRRDQQRRVPRRAARRLPQPARRLRARAQARGAARRHRA